MKWVMVGLALWNFPLYSIEDTHLSTTNLCSHTLTPVQAYNCCVDLSMQIWTELDLLGAIRTSTEDLMYFADKLVDKLLWLQHALSIVKNYHGTNPYFYEEIAGIYDLTRQIDDRFLDIFSTISSKETACCIVLIERLQNILESFSFKNSR